ncbi:MAG: diphosphomevalonate decarboxylase [Myxococcota bacterium]
MGKVTARAHPNIALVKYWGKRDLALNLPAVPSVSLTLDGFVTTTTVTWGAPSDRVVFDGEVRSDPRALAFLDRIDADRPPCEVVTTNNFPTGAGLASSASGFAALALAASRAAGQTLDETSLSVLARQGSGSACRSIFGGFVAWDLGDRADGLDDHARPLASPIHWDVRMVVAVVADGPKAVGSTAGMERSRTTSPLWPAWVEQGPGAVQGAIEAIEARDLERLGTIMEQSTFAMHATMQTATPPLLYWQPATVAVLHAVFGLRAKGVGAWATMDAGPQVKVLCEAADADRVAEALRPYAIEVYVHGPGEGAHVVADDR